MGACFSLMETHINKNFMFRYSVPLPQESSPKYININNYQRLHGWFLLFYVLSHFNTSHLQLSYTTGNNNYHYRHFFMSKPHPTYKVMFNVLYVRTYGY
jgi:hypothetical protein